VPRVSSLIYETYQDMLAKIPRGLTAAEHAEAVGRARTRLRDEVLGGRLLFSTVGTAPTAPEART
jgi:hypothetical protein